MQPAARTWRRRFPPPVGLFSELDSPLSLAFLSAFGSRQAAAGLGEHAIAAWLATVPRRGSPAPAAVLAVRLAAAPPGTGDDAAQAAVTAVLTAAVTGLAAQARALETQIAAQLAVHPEAGVFTSLPRAGTLRAARLLAETGDCRARYPDPQALAAVAGVSPVTRQSRRYLSHEFRHSANRELRDALCDFAGDSRHDSAWAAEIYGAARARGKDHPHAVRITACAWVPVLWRCWQDGTGYDPGKYRALQDILARQAAGQQEDR